MKKIISSALLLGLLAGGATAQSSNSDAGVAIITPLAVTVAQNINWGVIAPSATESGLVRTDRNPGWFVCQNVTCLGGHETAIMHVTGEVGRTVNVNVDSNITLTNSNSDTLAATLNADIMEAGGGNGVEKSFPIDDDGQLRVWVWGVLNIPANAAPGNYTGSFNFTAEYQ